MAKTTQVVAGQVRARVLALLAYPLFNKRCETLESVVGPRLKDELLPHLDVHPLLDGAEA